MTDKQGASGDTCRRCRLVFSPNDFVPFTQALWHAWSRPRLVERRLIEAPMLHRCLAPLICLLAVFGCTSTEGAKQPDTSLSPVDTGKAPEPEPPSATISIASVQMLQDCPDPPEQAPAADAPAPDLPAAEPPPAPAPASKPAARSMPAPMADEDVAPGAPANGFAPGFVQPCAQSTMQLALETDNEGGVAIQIKGVRLLSKGKAVGELKSRQPTLFEGGTYKAWDQQLEANTPTKASYKLSLPDWSAVEKAIGEGSFGHMFTLEVDVEIGGQLQTIQSPEFPREEPAVVVT